MKNRLEEVMRQEHKLRSSELEELQGRLHELRESDVAGEQALKRAAEMDHVEEEVLLAQCRKQTIENFFRRLEDEVLGNPRPDGQVRLNQDPSEKPGPRADWPR